MTKVYHSVKNKRIYVAQESMDGRPDSGINTSGNWETRRQDRGRCALAQFRPAGLY